MAAVIQFDRYDRRAVHRVVSDPTVYELAMDADAHAQEGIAYIHNLIYLTWARGAQGGEEERMLRKAGSMFSRIRKTLHTGLDLYAESQTIDPYLMSDGPDAA